MPTITQQIRLENDRIEEIAEKIENGEVKEYYGLKEQYERLLRIHALVKHTKEEMEKVLNESFIL